MHPVMEQALAPFKPKRSAKSTETFCYYLADVYLECELDYEAASGDGWNEPRQTESATLCEAFHKGEDILQILSDAQIAEIEEAFLERSHDY